MDPLRALLRAARAWRVPPTVFLQWRTVDTAGWTEHDSRLAMALEDYEAGLCPGGEHVLAETSRPEHADAYRPGPTTRCHKCTAQAVVDRAAEDDRDSAGLIVPLVLDPELVALNLLPVPPIPPELLAAYAPAG